jgi:hypothetical protein
LIRTDRQTAVDRVDTEAAWKEDLHDTPPDPIYELKGRGE